MVRKLIVTEGIPSEIPNTWFARGSLRMDDDAKLPVTMGFDYSSVNNIIGWAQDLQRDEETNEVSIDVMDLEIELNEEEYDYTFYATDVVQEIVKATDEVPEYRLITAARIRGVAIIPNAANPKQSSHKLQGS